jgi:2-oxoglutarate dehydrogenase E2 component (dihydrolipoamide succinyltransferase)
VKNETAMLTTFNEVDMSAIMKLRNDFQKSFVDKFGIKLGFMAFFIKAASIALTKYPEVNAMIDGENIVYHNYTNIGIAVQSPKGLMVPVIKNVENLSLANIELTIKDFAEKSKNNKITLNEMLDGTFTVTNGGTFGSLLSTPIINPPQSAILGMHNILDRPIALNGSVVIRPMMYIALSYDHRLIDGKSSVGFLVTIKKLIENPLAMLFDSKSPEETLLDL